ncbi:MAG TPA: FliI/YscN family ATPase [Geminicoccaceae bacterium]|nr:FliI/YscN family ATPase [Geminicoccaceae bacterium]
MSLLQQARSAIEALTPIEISGEVQAARGPLIEAAGLGGLAPVGSCCAIARPGRPDLTGEIIGFHAGSTLLLLHSEPHGVAPGAAVRLIRQADPRPCATWLGRVVDAFGRPLDETSRGPLLGGETPYSLKGRPPPAFARRRVGARIETGIKAIDTLLPLCRGQRVGIFAGSGVGKSSLLAMLARHVAADVIVIGLIGERGKEVNEFLEDTLGPDGMARAVTVIATSDEPPLVKRQAARLTLTVAEFFRDQGQQVLCLFDSITRFADAQREIGLASGEPPTTRAYPPSTFGEMSALLERAGPGRRNESQGDITAVFTVLVQGGDMDEPVADAVRAILDGHIVLDRAIAERGRFPAVDVLKSVSRALPGCHSAGENALALATRKAIADYEAMATMIRIGAYRAGSDAETDRAIQLRPEIESFLAQPIAERVGQADAFAGLGRTMAMDPNDEAD